MIESALTKMAGEKAIDAGIRLATAHLEAAERAAQANAESCGKYLSAVSLAVQGLEGEFDEILIDARNCNPANETERHALALRIDHYFYEDRLRPILEKSAEGIRKCKEALARDANAFWGRLPWKNTRRAAVAELVQQLENLHGYIVALDTEGLQFLPARTGVGVQWLSPIRQALDARLRVDSNAGPELRHMADDALADHNKADMRRYVASIEGTINDLRDAFR